MVFNKGVLLNRLGLTGSIACVIHCLVLPVALSVGLQLEDHWAIDLAEVLLAITCGFAVFRLVRQYPDLYRINQLLTNGLKLIILALALEHFSHWHTLTLIISLTGSALLIIGHVLHLKHCRCANQNHHHNQL